MELKRLINIKSNLLGKINWLFEAAFGLLKKEKFLSKRKEVKLFKKKKCNSMAKIEQKMLF